MKNKPVSALRVVLAFFFDVITSFLIFGYIIAWWIGEIVNGSFHLEGTPGLVCFVLMFAYFILMDKYFNGTIGKKILGVRKIFVESHQNKNLEANE